MILSKVNKQVSLMYQKECKKTIR